MNDAPTVLASDIWGLAVIAFVVGRLAEWRVHRKNYELMRSMGAWELAPWVMRGYYALTVLVVPAAFLEQHLSGDLPTRSMIVGGAMLAGISALLRLWAIRSLGSFWTMRCMALPGLRHRAVGPYRLIENPEYLSRLMEG